MNPCKKYLLPLLILAIFVISTGASYAFTVVQPDYKPPTPAERKAQERRERKKNPFPQETSTDNKYPEEQNTSSYQGSGGAAPSQSTITETPKPEPSPKKTPAKPAKKEIIPAKTIVFLLFGFLIVAMVAWYLTRNVNFSRLFK